MFLIFDGKGKNKKYAREVAEKYYGEIFAYCRYHLNFDKSLAEECTQDVFETFFRCLLNTEIRSPRAWLYRTADNYINRYIRSISIQKNRIVPFPNMDDEYGITKSSQFMYYQDFETVINSKTDFDSFERELLSCLKSNEIELFNLYFQKCKSIHELSLYMNKSESAINKRLQRIRIKIKKKIKMLSNQSDTISPYK
jgi:RNA polymerase sigma factor (sigma-70 family)